MFFDMVYVDPMIQIIQMHLSTIEHIKTTRISVNKIILWFN